MWSNIEVGKTRRPDCEVYFNALRLFYKFRIMTDKDRKQLRSIFPHISTFANENTVTLCDLENFMLVARR